MTPGRAVIIGASSGIGLEIARLHLSQGWRVAVAARRESLLRELFSASVPAGCIAALDVTAENGPQILEKLVAELGGADRIYFVSGTGELNAGLEWEPERATLAVNVTGFARLAVAAMGIFERQRAGHLIGISSIAALRAFGEAPAYGASKAFMSRYLQGLRLRARASGLPVYVTDVRPGFVATAMMKADKPFWVASAEKAAGQIVAAADRRAKIVYVTRRWALIGWLLKALPE
ncbi:MAG: oxidoreductase [Akkermansiaceae bacterium]|nr:oxidoreductase [Akkermansiaceae bacterium]